MKVELHNTGHLFLSFVGPLEVSFRFIECEIFTSNISMVNEIINFTGWWISK
jgi:hypothetical protein